MFERFSAVAKAAVTQAHKQARELRSPVIDVEHVLLGLLAVAEPALREVFAEAGVTQDDVRARLAERGAAAPLGEHDAEALRSIGIDLDAVRASLEASFGEDALERSVPEPRRGLLARIGHTPLTREAKKVIELSLRETLARKDRVIDAAHLALAVLCAPNSGTAEILGGDEAIARLRPRVTALLDRAA